MSVNHNIAVLIANGFNEKALVDIQKLLRSKDMVVKMVSSENGVVNGWADNTWGCFFPVDVSINEALASDFSGVIVMGGDKSIQRLKKTAHTQRFVSSFDRVQKPVLALDQASEIVGEMNASLVDTSTESLVESLELFLENVETTEFASEISMAA